MTMSITDEKVATISQLINTILTGLLVTGVCWLILEVTGSRERWARMEERLHSQSVHILELRSDINGWNIKREAQEERLNRLETRITVNESKIANLAGFNSSSRLQLESHKAHN